MCPFSAAILTRGGALFERARMVCHCLLIEGGGRLVLVDSGLGLAEVADPVGRAGRLLISLVAPRFDADECAVRQVERLGFQRDDVTDIVLTHLDFDHAGGIADFPRARVHVHGEELDAALARGTFMERERYKPAQWAHGPAWVRHATGGDRWMGFESVRAIGDGDVEVAIVPLRGHTRGHGGVAVRDGDAWLLHAGDGYFHRDEMAATPWCPPGFKAFQSIIAVDDAARRRNQSRLRELAASRADVRVFCAHDAAEFDRFA